MNYSDNLLKFFLTKNGQTEKFDRLLWYHQESNRGHKDFQSFALPTELWYQRYVFSLESATLFRVGLSLICECKGSAFC